MRRLTCIVGTALAIGCSTSSDDTPSCEDTGNVAWDGCAGADTERVVDVPAEHSVTVLLLMRTDEAALAALLEERSRIRQSGGVIAPLSNKEVRRRFGASDADVDVVMKFLADSRLSGAVDPTGTFVSTSMTHTDIKRLFRTQLGFYRQFESDREPFLAADAAPWLPPELRGPVDGLVGLNLKPMRNPPDTGTPRPAPPSHAQSFTCANDSGVTAPSIAMFSPMQLNQAYGVDRLQAGVNIPQPGGKPDKTVKLLGEGTRAAIVSTPIDVADFHSFTDCFSAYYDQKITVVYHEAKSKPKPPFSAEGIMDLQAIVFAAPHVEQIDFWGVVAGATVNIDGITGALTSIVTAEPPPDVLSLSIGFGSSTMRHTVNDLIAKGALRGIAAFAASGDSGVATCEGPLHSPQLTSVGATKLTLSSAGSIQAQTPTNLYFREFGAYGFNDSTMISGSCLHTPFDLPAYQSGAPGMPQGNRSRSAPDVVSVSQNAAVFAPPGVYTWFVSGNGDWMDSSGTSFATPYTAGAALLLAQASKQAGKGPLGPLNDYLYQAAKKTDASGHPEYGHYFFDVSQGDNCEFILETKDPLCSSIPPPLSCFEPNPNCHSNAHTYFDRPSGLGSIKFDALVDVVSAAPLPAR